MNIPIPHPTQDAVDAAAAAGLSAALSARGVPPLEQLPWPEVDPMQKLHARNTTLVLLAPATPHIAVTTARTIAAMLDQAGEHAAATKVHELVGEWNLAAQDPFGGN